MKITVHHVETPDGHEGVNAYVGPGAGDDADQEFRQCAVPPGGNRVRAYLDLACPDAWTTSAVVHLLRSLPDRIGSPPAFPHVGTTDDGEARWEINMDAGLGRAWWSEIDGLVDRAVSVVRAWPRGTVQEDDAIAVPERSFATYAGHRTDLPALVELLRGFAQAGRVRSMVEAANAYAAASGGSEAPYALFPGILTNHLLPRLGQPMFEAFVAWSTAHPDWGSELRGAAQQGPDAFDEAVRRMLSAVELHRVATLS